MYPKNSGRCSKFPGRLRLRPSIAQTTFVRVVIPRISNFDIDGNLGNVGCFDFDHRVSMQTVVIKNVFPHFGHTNWRDG